MFALVDIEAAATVVSKLLLDSCTAELKIKDRNIWFVGADGTDMPMLGVADLHFVVAVCHTIAEAFVSENTDETFMLRIDFLQKSLCEVSNADMTLSFKKSYDLPLDLLQYRRENSAEYLYS